MVAPVGFGRSVPLMAPAGSASGGSGKSQLDKAKELVQLRKKIDDDLKSADYKKLSDADAEFAAKRFLKSKKNKRDLDKLLQRAQLDSVAIDAKKDLPNLKSRAFKASAEGAAFFGGDKEYKSLRLEADTGDILKRDFGSSFDLSANAKLNFFSGSKESPGFTPGSVFKGPIRQITDPKTDAVGSATLAINYHPKEERGYELSLGGGIQDNQIGPYVQWKSPSFFQDDDKDDLRAKLTGAATRPIAADAEWQANAVAEVEFERDKNGKGFVKKAGASVEVQDLTGTNSVQGHVVLNGDLGGGKEANVEYTHTWADVSAYSFGFGIKLPIAESVYVETSGGYDGSSGHSTLGMPNSGVSLDGGTIDTYSQSEDASALKGKVVFGIKIGSITPYAGVGATRMVNAIENYEQDAVRWFIVGGLKLARW